jgi:hypothetical protein
MTGVAEFVQPNFTAQDAATYKGNIDAAIAVMKRSGSAFAPRQSSAGSPSAPDLTLTLEAGFLEIDKTMLAVASQIVGPIVAPASHPRNDLVYVDELTGAGGIVTGTEAASPSDPALPDGKLIVARINCTVGMLQITDSILDDLRGGAWRPKGGTQNTVGLATTLALPAYGDYLTVTDTGGSPQPQITAISSRSAGREIELKFACGTTVKKGASLILQGDADQAVSPGDIMRFRSEGSGTWRQVGYWPHTGAVPAGTYSVATVTVDQFGRVTSISSGAAAVNDQILIQDQKSSGTGGNTYADNAWRTVVLNTKVIDTGSNVASLASNQFALKAGSYEFYAEVNVGTTGGSNPRYRLRLRNVSDSATVAQGTQRATPINTTATVDAVVAASGSFVIGAQKTFELEVYIPVNQGTTAPVAVSSGDVEVYASIKLRRYA